MTTATPEQVDARRMTTGKVRLSFCHLFKPRERKGQEPKYSTMIIIPKTDTKTINRLKEIEARVLEEDAASVLKVTTGTPVLGQRGIAASIIKDADEDGSAIDYPEREGCLYLTVNCNTDFPPQVVDRQKKKIEDQSQVYSGVYVCVFLRGFAYKGDEKKGVSFGLGNVQIYTGEGEPLGGGRSADADFDVIDDEDSSDDLL